MPDAKLYFFIIETTKGSYFHAEDDEMTATDMESAVDSTYRLATDGAVMHVRGGRLVHGAQGKARAIHDDMWKAIQFNPEHVVNVYAVEAEGRP